ncbi:hypothetical protein FQA39_LY01527 [Lamprigera yunnana]|nr:hypothetical protein FQA39_LY01527 [Lamprigera yunnana]
MLLNILSSPSSDADNIDSDDELEQPSESYFATSLSFKMMYQTVNLLNILLYSVCGYVVPEDFTVDNNESMTLLNLTEDAVDTNENGIEETEDKSIPANTYTYDSDYQINKEIVDKLSSEMMKSFLNNEMPTTTSYDHNIQQSDKTIEVEVRSVNYMNVHYLVEIYVTNVLKCSMDNIESSS